MSKITKKDLRGAKIVEVGPYQPSVRQKPHMNNILSSAYHVLQEQLMRLAEDSANGRKFNTDEVKRLNSLIDSATRLSREERETAKAFDPTQLDDDELLVYAEEAAKLLGVGDGDDEV